MKAGPARVSVTIAGAQYALLECAGL